MHLYALADSVLLAVVGVVAFCIRVAELVLLARVVLAGHPSRDMALIITRLLAVLAAVLQRGGVAPVVSHLPDGGAHPVAVLAGHVEHDEPLLDPVPHHLWVAEVGGEAGARRRGLGPGVRALEADGAGLGQVEAQGPAGGDRPADGLGINLGDVARVRAGAVVEPAAAVPPVVPARGVGAAQVSAGDHGSERENGSNHGCESEHIESDCLDKNWERVEWGSDGAFALETKVDWELKGFL